MPTFPDALVPVPVSICVFTPMTWPRALRRGPPELPGLIGASVWMTWSMVKRFGAVIRRWSALTMPEVTVRSSPNGFPIATTESPTCTTSELPRVRGVSALAEASTRRTARSVEGSVPTTSARTVSRLEKLTVTSLAPSTTWKFVTIWPVLSMTKPEPRAAWLPPKGSVDPPDVELFVALIRTTPGAARS